MPGFFKKSEKSHVGGYMKYRRKRRKNANSKCFRILKSKIQNLEIAKVKNI
jgi:hypothetical protein